MEKIASFEKVSRKVFFQEVIKLYGDNLKPDEERLEKIYDSIILPIRATRGSAGYDIFTPIEISLKPGEEVLIPTGIRVKMSEDYCLFIVPRSGLGSRFRFQLNNTVGIIDSDYYYSDNEGQILVPMINDSRREKILFLEAKTAFVQGIFLKYGITTDDETTLYRNGGFGSTSVN